MSRSIKEFKEEALHKVVKHFKGGYYFVLGYGLHTETNEEVVIYFDINNSEQTYVRPIEMFVSKVDKVKYPESNQEYRFEIDKK